ncbi:MAG: AMP-binding protein [Nitriliruptoraceae bacterium]
MAELYALRVDRARTGALLAWTWERSAAAVVLAEDATGSTAARLLDQLAPAALVEFGRDGRPRRQPLPDPVPIDDEVALVVTTSGSSGRPKGVELSRAAVQASVAASLRRLGARHGDRWGLALPTHHVAGITVHLRAAALGTEAVVATDTAAVADLDVEHLALVPSQLDRLLTLGAPVARFTTILLGGAPASDELLARADAAGARVVRSYGMTETVGGCVYDGLPLDDVEVAVGRTDQVIRLRGPVLFRGYRGRDRHGRVRSAPALDADGWFRTSDLGRWSDGRLEVLGRADDVLVSGGENVPLQAVVERLLSHPGVADAAVLPAADQRWGEVPVAVVVPRDPGAPPSLEQLRTHVRREAPAAYAPGRLLVLPALPRDQMGKLSRSQLERLVAETRPSGGR